MNGDKIALMVIEIECVGGGRGEMIKSLLALPNAANSTSHVWAQGEFELSIYTCSCFHNPVLTFIFNMNVTNH